MLTDYPVTLIRALRDCGPYEALEFLSRLIWSTRLIAASKPTVTYLPEKKGVYYTRGVHKASATRETGGCLIGTAMAALFPELVPAMQVIDSHDSIGFSELFEQILPINVTGLNGSHQELIDMDLRWLSALQSAEASGYSWVHAINFCDATYYPNRLSDVEGDQSWDCLEPAEDFCD